MPIKLDVIDLARKLVSIPSYVDKKTNEKKIGDFIFSYLKTIPYLSVKRQKVTGNRNNIIAFTKGKTSLFLAGHMDTVQPKIGWNFDQFQGKITSGKLFGLGAYDNKSGIAAILSSLTKVKNASGLKLLFYCDEEYGFAGMRKFVDSEKGRIGKTAVVSEPTQMKIWNAHRGLIEIRFSVFGKTGHPAHPNSGLSAISGMRDLIAGLNSWLSGFSDPVLGRAILNVAFFRGGLYLGSDKSGKATLGMSGNNIPDFCEVVIEIRTPSKNLNGKLVASFVKRRAQSLGLKVEDCAINIDLGAFKTETPKLRALSNAVKANLGRVSYLDPRIKGYSDGQLLSNRFIGVSYFGPSGGNAHSAGEWIEVGSIYKLEKIYRDLIEKNH